MKVTILGAGNVGGACAQMLFQEQKVREIVLLDNNEFLAEGKVLDILQMGMFGSNATRLVPSANNYEATRDSDVVVVTAGVARTPGMTREELITVNTSIVYECVHKALIYSPSAKIIIATNPVDSLTYLVCKRFNLPMNRVIGMGGVLDTARFKYHIQNKLQKSADQIQAIVIGGHNDKTMMPLARLATFSGVSIIQFLTKNEVDEIVEETIKGGATITEKIGSSAWIAPARALTELVLAIAFDKKSLLACSVLLDGEYDEKDLCIGVPCIIGKDGVEKIVELPLIDQEKVLFNKSAAAIKSVNLEMLNL